VAREHADATTNILSAGTFGDEITNDATDNGIPVTLAPPPPAPELPAEASVVSGLSAQDIEPKPPAPAGAGLEHVEPSVHLFEAGSADPADLFLDFREPLDDDRLGADNLQELLAEVGRDGRLLDLCRESPDGSGKPGQLTLDPVHSR